MAETTEHEVDDLEFLEPEAEAPEAAVEVETVAEPLTATATEAPTYVEPPVEAEAIEESPAIEDAPLPDPVLEAEAGEETPAPPSYAEWPAAAVEPDEPAPVARTEATFAGTPDTETPEADADPVVERYVEAVAEAEEVEEAPVALDAPAPEAEVEAEPEPDAQPATRNWSNWSSWNGTAGAASAERRFEAAAEADEPVEPAVAELAEEPEVEQAEVEEARGDGGVDAPEVEAEPVLQPAHAEHEPVLPDVTARWEAEPAALEAEDIEDVEDADHAETEEAEPVQPAAADVPALPRVHVPLEPRFVRQALSAVAADGLSAPERLDEQAEEDAPVAEPGSSPREAPAAQQGQRPRPGSGGSQRLPQPPASATPPFSSSRSRLPPVRSRPPLPR
ncbi:MAG: hypothetical protein GEU80_15345 [Dehalococcoidia bacterium]|nr:hypothetical protein [Dehalococcoidia bacterium]